MTVITIGLTNYTGAACGFGFTNSKCIVGDDAYGLDVRLRRLKALFANTAWEKVPEPAVLSGVEALPPSGSAEPPATDVKIKQLGGRKRK